MLVELVSEKIFYMKMSLLMIRKKYCRPPSWQRQSFLFVTVISTLHLVQFLLKIIELTRNQYIH